MGLNYSETRCLPFGELLDMIAIDQIKMGGFSRKHVETEEDFWRLMEME